MRNGPILHRKSLGVYSSRCAGVYVDIYLHVQQNFHDRLRGRTVNEHWQNQGVEINVGEDIWDFGSYLQMSL